MLGGKPVGGILLNDCYYCGRLGYVTRDLRGHPHRCHGVRCCFCYGFGLRDCGADDFLPNCGNLVLRLTFCQLGHGFRRPCAPD